MWFCSLAICVTLLWQMWKAALKRADRSNYFYIGINVILDNYHFLNASHLQIYTHFNHVYNICTYIKFIYWKAEESVLPEKLWIIIFHYICLPIAAFPQICTLRLVCSSWDLAFCTSLRIFSYLCWAATCSLLSSASHGFHSSLPKGTWSIPRYPNTQLTQNPHLRRIYEAYTRCGRYGTPSETPARISSRPAPATTAVGRWRLPAEAGSGGVWARGAPRPRSPLRGRPRAPARHPAMGTLRGGHCRSLTPRPLRRGPPFPGAVCRRSHLAGRGGPCAADGRRPGGGVGGRRCRPRTGRRGRKRRAGRNRAACERPACRPAGRAPWGGGGRGCSLGPALRASPRAGVSDSAGRDKGQPWGFYRTESCRLTQLNRFT